MEVWLIQLSVYLLDAYLIDKVNHLFDGWHIVVEDWTLLDVTIEKLLRMLIGHFCARIEHPVLGSVLVIQKSGHVCSRVPVIKYIVPNLYWT